MKFKAAAILASLFLATLSAAAQAALPSIFTVGDSTCKNSGNGRNGQPIQGWGTPLGTDAPGWTAPFDKSKCTVKNVGHAGKSATTYYTGDWIAGQNVVSQIQPGDFVILVMGINGDPHNGNDDTVSANGQHSYGWYMRKMATDTIEKGGHPYFLTLTNRDTWSNPNAKFDDTGNITSQQPGYDPKADKLPNLDPHVNLTLQIGEQLHLPVFNLNAYQMDEYLKQGREKIAPLYSDHNHTYIPGAQQLSKFVVAGLKSFKNSPFIPLLSDAGKAIPAADAKYIKDNIPEATATATAPATAPAANSAAPK